jgi:hypothetical protein
MAFLWRRSLWILHPRFYTSLFFFSCASAFLNQKNHKNYHQYMNNFFLSSFLSRAQDVVFNFVAFMRWQLRIPSQKKFQVKFHHLANYYFSFSKMEKKKNSVFEFSSHQLNVVGFSSHQNLMQKILHVKKSLDSMISFH